MNTGERRWLERAGLNGMKSGAGVGLDHSAFRFPAGGPGVQAMLGRRLRRVSQGRKCYGRA